MSRDPDTGRYRPPSPEEAARAALRRAVRLVNEAEQAGGDDPEARRAWRRALKAVDILDSAISILEGRNA